MAEQDNINPLAKVSFDKPEPITSTEDVFKDMQLNFINKDLKLKAKSNNQTSDVFRDYLVNKSIANPLQDFAPKNKIKFNDYSIDPQQAYTTLNSGEMVPIYENFLPNINNQERLARQQSTGEKWANGLAKFGTSTLNTVVGGTIGTIYGIGSAISEGNFQSIYDNDFSNYLDDLNTKMRYELPNYYTKQEQDNGFISNMGTANFWADKVLGAASFTIGAVISEGIWAAATGGASLTTTAARWGGRLGKAGKWSKAVLGEKAVKAASSSYKSWMNKPLFSAYKKTGMLNKDAAISAAKTAEVLNTSRFLLTSSGYEAGVEALHYKKEAEENFLRSFYELNGRQPTAQEIADFQENVENSSNAVFGGNIALLSVSNAVMFGSLFNIKSPFRQVSKGVNRRLFGTGVEKTAEKGVFKALAPTKNQKLFSGVYSIAKPLATEGLFEEGGQGSMSKAASVWTESGYDPKHNGNTINLMDALSQGMAETYGTKEGWEEIGIGFIIGGGASIIQGKGKPLDLKQIQEGRKNQEKLVEKMNTFSQDALVKRMVMNNKIQGAVQRELESDAEGNSVEAELANQDKFLAEIEFKHSIGEDITKLSEKYRIALENMTPEQYEEMGVENAEEYIDTVISAYDNVARTYKKNIRYAEAVYGVDVQKDNYDSTVQAQALAYAITTGETSSTLMEDALSEIGKEIGLENERVLKLESELQRLTKNQRTNLSRKIAKLKVQKEKQDKLVKKIQEVQNAPKETEGDRQTGSELAKLNNSLLETQEEISILESELNRFKEELSQERTRRTGLEQEPNVNLSELSLISLEDLTQLDDRIGDINNLINSYQGSNPQLYRKLTSLTDYYNRAKDNFVRYNNIGIALSSGKVRVKPKKVGGLIGKLFDKGEYTQDEFTQSFLTDTLGWYVANRGRDYNQDINENTPIEELYIPITEERVENIAEKLRTNRRLSKREQRLYNNNEEKIEQKVKELNKEKGDNPNQTAQREEQDIENEVDQLKQRLEDAMEKDYYPLQYVGENYEEIVKNKPSDSDIERYRELLQKERTQEEEVEYQDLYQKLSNWRVLDSAVSGSQSLADIINLIQQLETQVEQDETVTKVTEEFDTQIVDDNLGSGTMVVYELTQNTSGNATAKILKNNRIKLSHLKIDTILDRLGGSYIEGKSGNDKIYSITPENYEGSVDITVTSIGSIEMNLDDFLSLQQPLNLYIVDSGQTNWTYKDIYQVVGNDFIEKESDFIDDDIIGDAYELNKEDSIELYYDSQDKWNQDLYKKYKKGKATKEEFRNQLKIYIRKDGKNFGTLKSLREGSVDENMMSIRDNAVEVSELEQNTTVGTTTVSQIMLGSPKFILNETNKPTELNFTDRAIEEVLTTGYILDNEFTLSDKTLEEKTDQSFVGKISKNQQGKKIPVVVVKKGVHNIAYPISIVKKDNSQASRFEAIMNNEFSNSNEKVGEINNLLISLGISPSTYNLIDLNEQDKLEKIQEDLNNYKVYTTADDFANKYDKTLLKYDATIKIDLEDLNRSISSPKVRIDLENITLYQTSDVKYENMSDLEDVLSRLSIDVDNIIMNDYVDSKGDAIENNLTDVYADDSVIKNPQNQLDKMHNVRMLVKAYPLMSSKFKNLLGQDKVKQIDKAIKKIEFLKKQVDTKANKEVQKKKNELKC